MIVMKMLKQKTYRSEKWLKAVKSIECCVLCGAHGVQAAHRNEGKGTGIKTDDCLTAALCEHCHFEIDNGNTMKQEERRRELDKAIVLTLRELARNGRLQVIE